MANYTGFWAKENGLSKENTCRCLRATALAPNPWVRLFLDRRAQPV
ncbi:hypothetical protein [Pseudotabrizicola sp. L79]